MMTGGDVARASHAVRNGEALAVMEKAFPVGTLLEALSEALRARDAKGKAGLDAASQRPPPEFIHSTLPLNGKNG